MECFLLLTLDDYVKKIQDPPISVSYKFYKRHAELGYRIFIFRDHRPSFCSCPRKAARPYQMQSTGIVLAYKELLSALCSIGVL